MRMFQVLITTVFLAACASTGVVSTGPDTYMIAKSGGIEMGSGAEVTADLYREANAFCAEQKKQLMTIKVTALDSKTFVRKASSELQFRCVAQGDPALVPK